MQKTSTCNNMHLQPEQEIITYSLRKIKCTLVQALRLCTGRTVHRGSRGIALPFHDHGTRKGLVVSVTPRPLFTSGKDPVPIVQEIYSLCNKKLALNFYGIVYFHILT